MKADFGWHARQIERHDGMCADAVRSSALLRIIDDFSEAYKLAPPWRRMAIDDYAHLAIAECVALTQHNYEIRPRLPLVKILHAPIYRSGRIFSQDESSVVTCHIWEYFRRPRCVRRAGRLMTADAPLL